MFPLFKSVFLCSSSLFIVERSSINFRTDKIILRKLEYNHPDLNYNFALILCYLNPTLINLALELLHEKFQLFGVTLCKTVTSL